MDLMKRLSKAKTKLILNHPFVGTIAMNMQFILTDAVPTAATNGKHVLFNPDFITTLDDEEMVFLVAHECMHPMLEHNYRRGERTHLRWNHAADYVINKLLVDDHIGKMPGIGLHSDRLYENGGGTSDGIYNLLPPEEDGGGGAGYDGPQLDDCQDGEGTQQQQEAEAAQWKVKVAQAAQAAKMMGKLSSGMERLANDILNPKVDWREVLRRFVEKCKSDQRSWARPNRRFLGQGIYMPSSDGEAMGELVLAIDCSGSVGNDDLAQFSAEARVIHEDNKPLILHTVYFDSRVCHHDQFTRDDTFKIEHHGGGGTAFSPIFKYIRDEGIEPVACVVLTDLYCSDYGSAPQYPVLWVTYGAEDAPWGEVVKM